MTSAARVPPTIVDTPDLRSVYDNSAEFVWFTLQRLGVRYSDLEDVCHDVFLIAHRKFSEFSGKVEIKAWLFGICLRVAANYRRKARFRYEIAAGSLIQDDGPMMIAPAASRPDQELVRRQAQSQAQAILDTMDDTKRLVFVMFELEGLSGEQIALELGIPLGTVYSRLHRARATFEKAAAQDQRGNL